MNTAHKLRTHKTLEKRERPSRVRDIRSIPKSQARVCTHMREICVEIYLFFFKKKNKYIIFFLKNNEFSKKIISYEKKNGKSKNLKFHKK